MMSGLDSFKIRLRGRGAVLASTAVLFAGVIAFRLTVANPEEVVLVLFVAPIALVAAEFGTTGGLAAATLSFALFELWVAISNAEVGAVGHLSRAMAFFLVGDPRAHDLIAQSIEEQHTRWFQMSRDLSCTAGFDGYFQRVNPAWERTFGYSMQELLSRPFIEFVHPDDREATAAAAAELVNVDASVVDFRNRYRAKDGTYRWIEWNACAVHSERLIYAAARDITERQKAEEAREEAEERFRTAFEGAPIGMALVGLDGRWLQVNEALCELTGYTRQELLSKGFQEITHPEDQKGDAEHARKLRDGEIKS
jgi:PAS domain S-box-containing protein